MNTKTKRDRIKELDLEAYCLDIMIKSSKKKLEWCKWEINNLKRYGSEKKQSCPKNWRHSFVDENGKITKNCTYCNKQRKL